MATGNGLIDPTAALTAEGVPAVLRNPLDTTASPGIAGFGNAPASGQAQSAPNTTGNGVVGTHLPGANGAAARAGDAQPPTSTRGWWAAGLLFLISAVAAMLTFRRFARLA